MSGNDPRWGTRSFPQSDNAGRLIVLASGRGASESLEIRSDAEVLGVSLFAGTRTSYEFRAADLGYLVVSSGAVTVNGLRATTGEAVVFREEPVMRVEALQNTELVFVVTAPEFKENQL